MNKKLSNKYKKCFICKECEKLSFYVDKSRFPIKTTYTCMKYGKELRDPFSYVCESFKLSKKNKKLLKHLKEA